MNKAYGRHIGQRQHNQSIPITVNRLLILGCCLQSAVIFCLVQMLTKPTAPCHSIHLGTTGNVYIEQPENQSYTTIAPIGAK